MADLFSDPALTRVQELCRDSLNTTVLSLILYSKGLFVVPTVLPYVVNRYEKVERFHSYGGYGRPRSTLKKDRQAGRKPQTDDPYRAAKGDWKVLAKAGIVNKIDLNLFQPSVGKAPLAVIGVNDRVSATKTFAEKLDAVANAVAIRRRSGLPGQTSVYLPTPLTERAVAFASPAWKLPPESLSIADDHHSATVRAQALQLTANDPAATQQMVESYKADIQSISTVAAERTEVVRRVNYGQACLAMTQQGVSRLIDFLYNVEFVYATWDNIESLRATIIAAKERLKALKKRPALKLDLITNESIRAASETGTITTKPEVILNQPRVEVW